ncbi:MAG: TetR/AcrR family transcriptional regulator [Novosphingobium sp.]|nr:TetR/AcrR family transcriptional regulator [Novosphingobium sp.]
MRADARENRRKILFAAEYVFEREGMDAPLDAIVAKAGVARATFFRHFPDRQQLLAAILARTIEDLRDEIDRIDAPAARLVRMMEVIAEGLGARPALSAYWRGWSITHPALQAAYEGVEAMFAETIEPAKAAGLCRWDLTASDMMMFSQMIGAAVRTAPPEHRTGIARRAARLLLEGYAARNEVLLPERGD